MENLQHARSFDKPDIISMQDTFLQARQTLQVRSQVRYISHGAVESK